MNVVNPAISQYLHEVEKEMTCSPKRKKELLLRLNTDIEEFADNYGGKLDKQSIEVHFGAPKDIAENFLATENYVEVKKAWKTKRIAIIAIIAICVIIVSGVAAYIAYDHWLQQQFYDGYIVERSYETVDGTPPPPPSGAKVY